MSSRRAADAAIDAFLADGITELPDRTFDAVRAEIHRTRQRLVLGPLRGPAWATPARLAYAGLVAVVAVIATFNLRFAAGPGGPTSPPVPTTSPDPATVGVTLISGDNRRLEPGRYRIDYSHVPGAREDGPSFVFDISAPGWTSRANYGFEQVYPEAISPGAALIFWNITDVYADPCTNHQPRSPAPGSGIDELLQALAAQAGVRAGPLTDVTVDGYAGRYVDLTIVADITSCADGYFTWGSETEGRQAQAIGEVDRVYALDVDGQRVTFFTRKMTDTPSLDVRQLERILAAIDIQP